jgi:hypothetical protein
MGSDVVQTPAEVMAKATQMLKRVLALQVVWFLCFAAGGVWVISTAWMNSHLPRSCPSATSAPQTVSLARLEVLVENCQHHSYLFAVLLILLGICGLFVTGYVATRLAVGYLGAGAAAFLRGGRRFMGPMGPRPDGPGPTGGSFSSPGIVLPPGPPRVPPSGPASKGDQEPD